MTPPTESADKNAFIMKFGILLLELVDVFLHSIMSMESAHNVMPLLKSIIKRVDVVIVLKVIIRYMVKDATVCVLLSVMSMKIL